MTFSRRAASKMSRRVESICAKAGVMTDALTWAGTFHAIGARLLREYAEQIGLHSRPLMRYRSDDQTPRMAEVPAFVFTTAAPNGLHHASYRSIEMLCGPT
jgi:superfamily I DNA/RNA helicase